MPVHERSHLWRTQFQLFLDSEQGLSDEQRAYVIQQIHKFTPEALASATSDSFDICERVIDLFPDSGHREVFLTLGAIASPDLSLSSISVSVTERFGLGMSPVRAAYASGRLQGCNCWGSIWCNNCYGSEVCAEHPCETQHACGCGEDPEYCVGICAVGD